MRRSGGLTLLELLVVFMIVSLLISIAAPSYQQYSYRARAAGLVVETGPIKLAIEEAYSGISGRYQLVNATDGSIIGCQAPAGRVCDDASATPAAVIVTADKLLIGKGTVRVASAPCLVDCPKYALSFSSDLSGAGTGTAPPPPSGTPPATPSATPPATSSGANPAASSETTSPAPPEAAPPASPPDSATTGKDKGSGKGKGGKDRDRQGGLEAWRAVSWLVPSAQAADGNVQQTNRVLYEFGELMRAGAHSVDNASCLLGAGPCTVTIKY